MVTGAIAKVWTFRSDSNPKKFYETLLYEDGSTSCNCPGWTRQVRGNGQRTCKHVRMVAQGIADEMCYRTTKLGKRVTVSVTIEDTPVVSKPANTRKVSFDD